MGATEQSEAEAEWAAFAPASTALRDGARDAPDRPALEVGDRVVTYGEMNVGVDRLAHRMLNDHGSDHLYIGMRLMDPYATMTATLAIQRAGMVAVPMDPTTPIDRVRAVLGEIEPALLLSDIDGDAEALPLPVEHPHLYVAEPPRQGVFARPGELFAIVFTSGSTGTPKGIMLSTEQWRQSSQLVRDYEARYELGTRRFGAIMGTAGLGTGQVHSALAFGGSLIAYPISQRGLSDFAEWLLSHRVSVITLIPTIWRYLADEVPADLVFPDLRLVALGGETPTWEDVAKLRPHLPRAAVIVNILGLTEVGVSRFEIHADTPLGSGPLPAGTPLPEQTVTIVDPSGQPVPDGVSGEIVVDTHSSALGYWRLPDLTARVFTLLPDGRRRVRTGDGGRILADGSLQHLGRLDHVVKVAGNRIELGDVEAALLSLPGVAHAAATTYTTAGNETRLVAFAVPDPGSSLHPTLLRAALARRVPGPMVPDAVHLLAEMPQLPGGKIDRTALPDRAGVRPDDGAAGAASTDLEVALTEIWRDVLGLRSVGVHDDFFALGGDSLRAARLFAEIEHRLGLDFPVALILEAPTVSALAAVASQGADTWQPIVPLQVEGGRPPLIVVHDGKGDVFYGQRLVPYLGPEQPVYGLLAPSPDIADRPETSLEAVATHYLERLRGLRPHGPYLFYGYSLGGNIAFEMARQLTSTGEEVLLVGLGDSVGPGHRGDLRPRTLAARARLRRKRLSTMSRAEAVRDIGRSVRHRMPLARRTAATKPTTPTTPAAPEDVRLLIDGRWMSERTREFLHWYSELTSRYVPSTPVASDLLLIRALDYDDRPDRGWQPFVDGEITSVDILAGHDQLHAPENTPTIGAAIRQAIDRVLVDARVLPTSPRGTFSED